MKELLLKRLKKAKNKKGFTLIEIIVVLVILGILAAIAVPAVMGYIDDAKESKYVAEAHSIYIVIQTEEARAKATAADDITYESIEKEAIKKTSLEDVTIAPTPINVTPKEEKATSYKVTWTSDDDKKIEATVKKNKDVKIDEVN
ncbi:prepilin-type N-terminal cleavage/methylation domain-containing protein [uncultured Thomasclavelia sp.]|uniref:prepilin-type N-terminal cleavage/methylation domain-containing protein n=1 Tax=uncultured Thomasclavelia sp. TaxID=3025759 RepID=UPI0025928528|nr:prepilin-type N-terminal cleavage/methylation domain-containing protein [uncultured Thomasclavelia sp.]